MTTSHGVIDNSGFRITRIRAKNYRSIRELDMELGPLTVLVGPNASGKSNVLDILRFIRDAVSRGLDLAVSERRGLEGIRHRSRRSRSRDIELGFDAIAEARRGSNLRVFNIEYNFALSSASGGGHRVKREYGSYMFYDDMIDGTNMVKPRLFDINRKPTDRFHPRLPFFENRSILFNKDSHESEEHKSVLAWHLFRVNQRFLEIGFQRASPNVIRRPQEQISSERLSEHGENLASVLREMQQSRRKRKIESDSEAAQAIEKRFPGTLQRMQQRDECFSYLRDDIRETLTHILPGITDVRSMPVGGHLVLKFKHSNIAANKELWLDAAQESDGTLRMLALLTAIYQRRRPSLLGIEEPELAIHPGVQGALAEILDEASLRTQIVITTHSPDLIDRFPVDCIRAVEFVDGETKVGEVSTRQASAVRERLFTLGELHSMEGLEINAPVAQ